MEKKGDLAKQYLAEAVFILMKSKPYDQISIQEITNKAGFSRMAHYRNFNSKDEMVQYYIHNIYQDFSDKIDVRTGSPQDYLLSVLENLTAVKDIGLILLKNNLLHLAKSEFDNIFRNKANGKSELYSNLFISGGLFGIYQLWLEEGCKETPEELAGYLNDLTKA